jgi:hypothetical protein
VCTNPDDRGERPAGKRLLFGNIHKHHLKSLKPVQEDQFDKWNGTHLVDGDKCLDTNELCAVSTRLHSRGDARMMPVKAVTGALMSY